MSDKVTPLGFHDMLVEFANRSKQLLDDVRGLHRGYYSVIRLELRGEHTPRCDWFAHRWGFEQVKIKRSKP